MILLNAIALVVLVGAAIKVNDFTGSLVFISTVVAIAIPEPGGRGTVILTVDDFTGFAGDLSRLSAVALVVVELGTIEIDGGTIVSIGAIVAIAVGEPIRRSAITGAICGFAGRTG